MKSLIKYLSTLMIICLLFGTVTVFAEDVLLDPKKTYTSADGLYKYAMASYRTTAHDYTDPEKVTLVKYIGKKPLPSKYTIPSKIDGFPVKVIGAKAFLNSKFTEVTFPKTVTHIKSKAFKNSKNLKTVTFKSVYHVAKEAFAGCTKLKKVKTKGISEIREKAFYNCTSLKTFRENSLGLIKDSALGIYYDKKAKCDKTVKGFTMYVDGTYTDALSNALDYAAENGIDVINNMGVGENDDYIGVAYHYNVGSMVYFRINYEYPVKYKSSDTAVATFDSDGKLLFRRNGTVTLDFETESGKKYTYSVLSGDPIDKIMEIDRPDVIVGDIGTSWYHGNRTRAYTVKVGKTIDCTVIGKVGDMPLSIKSSSIAKFIGGKNTRYLKIKGLKKGETTLKLRVNGIKQICINIKVE